MYFPIIPEPKHTKLFEGRIDAREMFNSFSLTTIGDDNRIDKYLLSHNIIFSKRKSEKGIWSLTSSDNLKELHVNGFDSYYLSISQDGIIASSETERGLFYSIITLIKLVECYTVEALPAVEIKDWSDAEIRCDYLDLRSIHPPFEHILENIKTIAEAKLNGVVIEYEDKLPIGEPFNVHNDYFSFTDEMLNKLKDCCKQNFIEIIPLQQSFGHLEYILKKEKYMYLREVEYAVGEMCPLRNGAFDVSKALIEAMIKRHPESRFLHIGCDEVWSLGQSEECKADGRTKNEIFIEYVNKLIDVVCKCGKIPLFWHDMLENASEDELSRLDKRAIICIWIYNGNDLIARVDDFITKLDSLNLHYWACPSVRCWDEDDRQNYPVLTQRLKNISNWSTCISRHNIKGVINTNWAACFALGKPYGIYESSFYTIYYAAERCWNTGANSNSFMYRFLDFFHGYKDENGNLEKRGWTNEDFYQILASLDGKLKRNSRIAHLIAILRLFELPTRRYFPLTVVLYRNEFFKSSDEVGSLKNKLESVKTTLEDVKPLLMKELSFYLDDYAVKQFIRSRYLVEELLVKKAEEMVNSDE